MADDNDPAKVLELQDPAALARRIEELEATLRSLKGDNVVKAAFPAGQIPEYKLNSACYFEDTYFEEGSVIQFTDFPNLEMVPLNDAAKAKMEEYIEMLTAGARAKAEASGRPFAGLITDKGVLIAQGLQDARAQSNTVTIAVPVDKGVVPLMPNSSDATMAKRRPGRPRKVLAYTPAPQPERPKPGAEQHAIGDGRARTFGG